MTAVGECIKALGQKLRPSNAKLPGYEGRRCGAVRRLPGRQLLSAWEPSKYCGRDFQRVPHSQAVQMESHMVAQLHPDLAVSSRPFFSLAFLLELVRGLGGRMMPLLRVAITFKVLSPEPEFTGIL